LRFKEFFYEESGFELRDNVVIPRRFEDCDEIIHSIFAAKKRSLNLPPPAPYVFKEMPHVRLKKMREKARLMRD